jgi:hypothetical protein
MMMMIGNEVHSLLHQGVHFNSNFGCREPKEKYLMKLISKAIGYNQSSVGHCSLTLLITFNLGFLKKKKFKIK